MFLSEGTPLYALSNRAGHDPNKICFFRKAAEGWTADKSMWRKKAVLTDPKKQENTLEFMPDQADSSWAGATWPSLSLCGHMVCMKWWGASRSFQLLFGHGSLFTRRPGTLVRVSRQSRPCQVEI